MCPISISSYSLPTLPDAPVLCIGDTSIARKAPKGEVGGWNHVSHVTFWGVVGYEGIQFMGVIPGVYSFIDYPRVS